MKSNLLFTLHLTMLSLFSISSTAQIEITKYGINALLSNTTGDYNSAFGYNSLYSNTTGSFNTATGHSALYSNLTGGLNTATGKNSLYSNTTGNHNTATGYSALHANSTGDYNTAHGYKSLFSNTTGISNTANGRFSLYSNTTASYNTATGYSALYSIKTGSSNTASGYKAGDSVINGSNNVFVGYRSGTGITGGSNNVYIGSSTKGGANVTNTIAIGYNVSATQSNTIILGTGQNVGIGTSTPKYRLEVCGTIRAKEIRVETGWCDYVFEKDYKLRSLEELEGFINVNKHLPGVAPASEVEKDGLKVAEMNKAMMEKIEELTLYMIEVNKRIKILENENSKLKKQMVLNQNN